MPNAKTLKMEKELAKEISILTKDVKILTKEVKKLKNLEFVKVLNRPFKFMWFALLKGMMVGFGSVLGASVLVGVAIYILAKISFVPIVGDFVQEVMTQINISVPQNDETSGSFIEQYEQATGETDSDDESNQETHN